MINQLHRTITDLAAYKLTDTNAFASVSRLLVTEYINDLNYKILFQFNQKMYKSTKEIVFIAFILMGISDWNVVNADTCKAFVVTYRVHVGENVERRSELICKDGDPSNINDPTNTCCGLGSCKTLRCDCDGGCRMGNDPTGDWNIAMAVYAQKHRKTDVQPWVHG